MEFETREYFFELSRYSGEYPELTDMKSFDDQSTAETPMSRDHSTSAPPAKSTSLQMFCWAMYDWANSAFPTVIQTFLFAAYFAGQVAQNETTGTSQWGYALGVAGLIVALGGPYLGAVTDELGRRKPWILSFMMLSVVATGSLWFVHPSVEYVAMALILVALATIGSEYSFIFYNAMLPDLTDDELMGRWSGWAYGLGYLGGLTCLAVALSLFVGPEQSPVMIRSTAFLVAGWFLVFSLPLFLLTPDTPPNGKTFLEGLSSGWNQLRNSIRNVRAYRSLIRFLIARMLYVDGLATLFAFGGVYAVGTFDMNERDILKFGIALNLTAGIGALAFGWIDDRIGAKRTLVISLIGLILPGIAVLLVDSRAAFWFCCLVLGVFVGPVQASSRSYLSRIVPPEIKNQTFGLYAFSGKATTFLGPFVVGLLTDWSGSQRVGMSAVIFLFVAGLVCLIGVPSDRQTGEIHSKS